jgi:hypothetical protein
MITTTLAFAEESTGIKLQADPADRPARWTVHGWPMSVVVWTPIEWAALRDRDKPADAQRCGNGAYAALRVD